MFNMQQKKSICIKVLQEKGKSADEFENFMQFDFKQCNLSNFEVINCL